MKKLLVSKVWSLVANAGAQASMLVLVKIVGCAGLGIGQVGENGSFVGFELFGFEAEPTVFGLGRTR